MEDLGDHGCLLGNGREPDAALVGVSAVAFREIVELAAVAAGGDSAHAVALLRSLAHAPARLAGELVALELIPQLLHPDEDLSLGSRRVTGAHGVVDRDADLPKLALEQGGVETVTGEAAGRVDHDRVEPPGGAVAGLGGQRGPPSPVLLTPRRLPSNDGPHPRRFVVPQPCLQSAAVSRRSADPLTQIAHAFGSAAGKHELLEASPCLSGQYLKELPFLRHALQRVQSAVGESEPRSGDEVLDGAREEHLAGARLGEHALADVHR